MTFKLDEPLERVEGESAGANEALRDYFAMGAGRSLRELLEKYKGQAADKTQTQRPPTERWGTLSGWSCKYDWVARVEAQLAIQHKADEEYWQERRWEIRRKDEQQADRLRGLADAILDEAPNFLQQKRRRIKGKEGQPDQVIVTLALKTAEAARLVDLASKLERLSAGMADPAKRVELEVKRELDQILGVLEDKLDDDTYSWVLGAIAGQGATGETEAD